MRALTRRALTLAVLAGLAGCSLTLDPEGVKAPPGGPAIELSTASLAFTAVAGSGASPAPRTLTVRNAGTGTLATPALAVTYGSGASGWLAVAQSGAPGGPYTVTATPTLGSLGVGAYAATVTVTCAEATNSPRSFAVTLDVTAGAPTLSVTPASLSFSATEGGASPAVQTLTIRNTGAGTLGSPTVLVTSSTAWLTVNAPAASGADWTVGVSAATGSLTSAGSPYHGQITVSYAGATNTPQTVDVTVTVASASQPTMSLSALSPFRATAGDPTPIAGQSLQVSNVGAGTLAAPTASTPSYTPDPGVAWLAVGARTGSAGGPYAFPLGATVTGLSPGTYTATFSVSAAGASNTPQSVTVTFEVAARPVGCVAAGARTICATDGAAQSPGGFSAGAAARLSSATHSVDKAALTSGGVPSLQSSTHTVRASALVPGTATP